jgi:AmmeMemoRadiSam system protein B/AmmeMemoRadiSam system protein A
MSLRAGVPALVVSIGLAGCTEPSQGASRPAPAAAPAAAAASPTSPSASPNEDQSPGRSAAHADHQRVRPSALAGTWYPAERSLVTADLSRMLRAAARAPQLAERPVALVVPHAGWRYSGTAAAAAYRNLHEGDFTRVVVVGPSHRGQFRGFSIADVDAYQTPLGEVPLCAEADALRDDELVRSVASAHTKEHSIEIQLPFLQHTLGSFCLIPILVGSTSPPAEQALAGKLADLHDGKTLFVFSSDFVHYGPGFGYTPYGPTAARAKRRITALERRAIAQLEHPNATGFRKLIQESGATICGRNGLSVMLELMPRIAPKARGTVLAHYASSDFSDADGVDGVWYVALAYARAQPGHAAPLGVPKQPDTGSPDASTIGPALGRKLVRIARATLETEIGRTRDLQHELDSPPFSPQLNRLRAVFVTLKRGGSLRGCVGQIMPRYPLTESVVRAATDAALHDGRFSPVAPEELSALSVEVTVLTPPRPVDSWRSIVLGRDGIVLTHRRRRAVFLPQVPGEQGWTLEQTLRALSHKAGLPESAWQSPRTRFSVFTGQPFEEASAAERSHTSRRGPQ